jgi:hypothetical protein
VFGIPLVFVIVPALFGLHFAWNLQVQRNQVEVGHHAGSPTAVTDRAAGAEFSPCLLPYGIAHVPVWLLHSLWTV